MEPDVLRRREGIQLSYRLPHRINNACVYPRKPSNGSTVIVCAHDGGLRIIWYAGKKPKQAKAAQTNGSNIDLTEEDNVQTPEYEDDGEEVDSLSPFHGVLKHLDVSLGSSAIHVSVPPLSIDNNDDGPPILRTHAIVLAACADSSLRLVAVPLEPAIEHEDNLQQVNITRPNSHQDLISGVAVTFTAAVPDDETNQDNARSRSRIRDGNNAITLAEGQREWSFLLASTSVTGTGLLLIHQIPVDSSGRLSTNAEDLAPVQQRFLRCSLAKCSIEFNPSLYPSQRHSSLLVASSDGGATKIFQALTQANVAKKRRGSATTIDSTGSGNQFIRKNSGNDKILIDLLPPFGPIHDDYTMPMRKRVLDAKWILYGRAIIVLLDDGEWGIWDIEAAGPGSPSQAGNLMKGQNNISAVQGGSITKFTIKGNILSSSVPNQSTSTKDNNAVRSSLAPMTPHTRKTRSQGLFKGDDRASKTETQQASLLRQGCLSVLSQSTNVVGSKAQEESTILHCGSNSLLIPSIQSYWRSAGSDKGVFDGSANGRPVVLPPLQTAGEELEHIHILPSTLQQPTSNTFPRSKPLPNYLAVTSSRLILFVTPLPETELQTSSLPVRSLNGSLPIQDQMLLDSGELDVDGMDRILDSMATSGSISRSNPSLPIPGFGRKSVGFQLDDDDDEDVGMGTPTVVKSSKSQLVVNQSSNEPETRRRLFT